jgi:N-hydroxyarylamine O-acetyltransferase
VFNRCVSNPWQTEQLDLHAYLARVGVPEKPPSREALDALHEAHVRAFTFDNIDVLLDQHPGVALDAVQDKFVGRGRATPADDRPMTPRVALDSPEPPVRVSQDWRGNWGWRPCT